jgi:uncharacterized protein YqfA (UPF0365 family)
MTNDPNLHSLAGSAIFGACLAMLAVVGGAVLARHLLLAVMPSLRAKVLGVPVGFRQIAAMRLKGVDPQAVMAAWLMLNREGVNVSIDEIELHLVAGGDVPHVTAALITARKLHAPLTWSQATAIDLAGRDAIAFAQLGQWNRGQNILQLAPRRTAAHAI